MEEITKPEETKDLLTVISETNILILDLNEHLRILHQNIDELKNDVYSNRIQTFNFFILLMELKQNINKIEGIKKDV